MNEMMPPVIDEEPQRLSVEWKETDDYLEQIGELIRKHILELQADNLLPSAPMGERDRQNLITTLIRALDRGQCADEPGAIKEWVRSNAQTIYDALNRT